MYEELKDRIKEHEGFRNTIYKDSLGFATIGYGHLVKEDDPFVEGHTYSQKLLNDYFELDFTNAVVGAEKLLGNQDMNYKAKCVIIEMVFQLGMTGVSKFKNTLKAVKKEDWDTAADEMLDSVWAEQTPERANELSSTMRSCKY
jgi:lysozyme|tara:strand:- start:768 stop:1199 length:432 start_codon:yes stop_codon:yes gene_type:complete